MNGFDHKICETLNTFKVTFSKWGINVFITKIFHVWTILVQMWHFDIFFIVRMRHWSILFIIQICRWYIQNDFFQTCANCIDYIRNIVKRMSSLVVKSIVFTKVIKYNGFSLVIGSLLTIITFEQTYIKLSLSNSLEQFILFGWPCSISVS